MTDENGMQAPAPAANEATTTSAEPAPAQETYHEQAAETPESENYDEQFAESHEEPADLGEILEEARTKKPSGAQRAKAQKEYLQNELSAREQRIAELERFINERDENDRQSEGERQSEAKRKRTEAHLERIKGASETITDFNRVMRKMEGTLIHEDLLEDVLSSEKSDLLAYHLASNPEKLDKLNNMSARERAREIGRLEERLNKPTGKKQTSAPPPPTNLKGGAAPHANPNTGPAGMNDFAAWLKKDLARRSGR